MCLIQEEEIMLKDLNQYEVASENKNDVADFFKKAY
jgi:hypothetical protein